MQREQTISGCPTSDQFTAFYHPRAPICHGYPVPGDLYNLAATRKMLIIDVREAEELSAGSIPGAIGIPRGLIEMAADTAFRGHHRVLCTAHSKTGIVPPKRAIHFKPGLDLRHEVDRLAKVQNEGYGYP
jgi:rhodanese-related sulfurtransferase